MNIHRIDTASPTWSGRTAGSTRGVEPGPAAGAKATSTSVTGGSGAAVTGAASRWLETLHEIPTTRTAVVAAARAEVDSGALLSPGAAREAAEGVLRELRGIEQ